MSDFQAAKGGKRDCSRHAGFQLPEDTRIRCVDGRWYYVHEAYKITHGIGGKVIEDVEEALEAADSRQDAIARADWYDQQLRDSRMRGASEGQCLDTVFDGAW